MKMSIEEYVHSVIRDTIEKINS